MFKTNKDLTIKKGAYCAIPNCTVFIPAGSPLGRFEPRNGGWFVSPLAFEFNSFDYHDAMFHGFTVEARDVDFCFTDGYKGFVKKMKHPWKRSSALFYTKDRFMELRNIDKCKCVDVCEDDKKLIDELPDGYLAEIS